MNVAEIDRRIAELQAARAVVTAHGALRPVDDETLQLLGLVAADAARAGRLVPEVPLLCDSGKTARLIVKRAALLPGDRLIAVPPWERYEVRVHGDWQAYLSAWGARVQYDGNFTRANR